MIDEVRVDLLAGDRQLLLPLHRRGQGLEPVDIREVAPAGLGAVAIGLLADGREFVIPCGVADGRWRRAEPGDGVALEVFTALAPLRSQFTGRAPAFDAPERVLATDMSNDLVVVDEALAVKWMFLAERGRLAGPRLVSHLDQVGFDRMPRPRGLVTWDGRLIASATDFLPGAVDGWEWMVDDVLSYARGDSGPPTWPYELGALVADLHRCAALPSEVMLTPTVMSRDLAPLAAHYGSLLGRIDTLDEQMRAALDPWRSRFESAVLELQTASAVRCQPIHGDLHAGQFLRWSEGLVVSDFDGNPLLPAEHRGDPGPTAFDVATLRRSLDHVAEVVMHRDIGEGAQAVVRWSSEARDSVLTGYLANGGELDRGLLAAVESLSPLHEAVYAADYLPRWRYVPLGVLARGW